MVEDVRETAEDYRHEETPRYAIPITWGMLFWAVVLVVLFGTVIENGLHNSATWTLLAAVFLNAYWRRLTAAITRTISRVWYRFSNPLGRRLD